MILFTVRSTGLIVNLVVIIDVFRVQGYKHNYETFPKSLIHIINETLHFVRNFVLQLAAELLFINVNKDHCITVKLKAHY